MNLVSASFLLTIVFASTPLLAESVLSHEEIIDIAWDSDIKPALLKRFPQASPEELKKAHAFAYGGSVVDDVGYYPLSNHKFTDLLHYVRTGDFVAAVLRDSRDLDEYAFALGVLSHYVTDFLGHHAINTAVPEEYPKLRAIYGPRVTYEDNHNAHLRTEFSFDVLEVAKHRYNAGQYHDFIGFQVSEDLLERAFADTYGASLDDLLHYDDLTLATFRFSVSKVIPEITQVAIATHKPAEVKELSDRAKQEFVYHISRADYEKEFGSKYRRPGIFARILGFFLRLVPFGPARVLGYRNPTPQTEDLFFRSMDRVVTQYHEFVSQVNAGDLRFPNLNLDTGAPTRPGEYALADRTYADLLRRLAHMHFANVSPELKANLLDFFDVGVQPPPSIKAGDWKRIEGALAELKATSASTSKGESIHDPH